MTLPTPVTDSAMRPPPSAAGLEHQCNARRRPGEETDPPAHQPVDEDDGALPPHWQDLAAYSGPTTHRGHERYFDEIGEEPQAQGK